MTRPRLALHETGFLKIELSDGRRLHLWSPFNPLPETSGSSIHDHPFDFESQVLAGALEHVIYRAIDDINGQFEAHTSACESSYVSDRSALVATGRKVKLSEAIRRTYVAGDTYVQKGEEFHETIGKPAALTVFRKLSQKPTHGTVFVPVGAKFEDGFNDRALDQDVLWDAVNKGLTLWNLTFENVVALIVRKDC